MTKLLPFFSLPLLLAASYGAHFIHYNGDNSLTLDKSLQRADLLLAQQNFSGAIEQLSIAANSPANMSSTAQQRMIELCHDPRIAALEIRPFQQLIHSLLRQTGELGATIHQQLWSQSNNTELSLQQRFIITKSIATQADSVNTLGLDDNAVTLRLIDLYQQWLVLHPADHKAAQELAMLYFKQRRINEMVALLQPHRQFLGSSEAASVLGQLYYSAKNYTAAEKYLIDYSQPRLLAIEQLKQQISQPQPPADTSGLIPASNSSPQQQTEHRLQQNNALQQQVIAISPIAEQLASLLVILANSGNDPKHRQQRLDKAQWVLTTLQPLAMTTASE